MVTGARLPNLSTPRTYPSFSITLPFHSRRRVHGIGSLAASLSKCQETIDRMNIYVGNLSYQTTEDELRDLFAEFGDVVSAKLIADKFTGQSKGFGFVEMSNNSEAQKAMDELNASRREWSQYHGKSRLDHVRSGPVVAVVAGVMMAATVIERVV